MNRIPPNATHQRECRASPGAHQTVHSTPCTDPGTANGQAGTMTRPPAPPTDNRPHTVAHNSRDGAGQAHEFKQ